jgi:hypothetical protein
MEPLMSHRNSFQNVIICYAEGNGDNWEAFCLSFDLAVQGRNFPEVFAKLNSAVEIFLEGVKDLPVADQKRLLSRRAPSSAWLGPFVRLLVSAITRRDNRLRHEFTLPARTAASMA